MGVGALLIRVNALFFGSGRNTDDENPGLLRRSISAGPLVKNKQNTSEPAHTTSPHLNITDGVIGIIPIAATHTNQPARRRNKPEQADLPAEWGARHC